MTTPEAAMHDRGTHPDNATCEHCLVPAPTNRSAKIAWTVASIAIALLILVFFLGVGSNPSTLLAAGGFGLLGMILCPIVMGGMMWVMMRKKH